MMSHDSTHVNSNWLFPALHVFGGFVNDTLKEGVYSILIQAVAIGDKGGGWLLEGLSCEEGVHLVEGLRGDETELGIRLGGNEPCAEGEYEILEHCVWDRGKELK